MSGIGDVFLSHLSTRASASTAELAALVPEKPFGTVRSRLAVLVDEGRLVRLSRAERREDDLWTLDGAKSFIALSRGRKTVSVSPRPAGGPTVKEALASVGVEGKSACVWDPLADVLRELASLVGMLVEGDRLLVRYPEPWRDSVVCVVTRSDGYFGQPGVAQAWNVRDHGFLPIDAVGWRERGWDVRRLTAEQAEALVES